MSSIKTLKQES